MFELQDGKATIEPPPASTIVDGADVHVHELATVETLAPSLLDTSESTNVVMKGNQIQH